MSTHSNIVVERANGKFSRIYCHSDGYLSYNGVMLLKHYASQELAEAIVALGDCSFLNKELGEKHDFDLSTYKLPDDDPRKHWSRFYARDRDEEGTGARLHDTLREAIFDHEGYCYIWRYKEGAWFFTGGVTVESIVPLDQAVREDAEQTEDAA